ncbi:hypothetical protein [Chryseobacterium sp. Hurlbut01]|jgi:hypothetical protein|uniref:hypothetical protein n=1 Tax=Chryseobacterium sp. Hurlbut01 TaxID=1681828 RepID=UPI00067B02BA|nr:hypothetical protein [Chryseobacterium sp. Hurlbut01]KNB61131.1 hypothetical protein AC804_11075 [Chryseobacterium sp. Hurlbut01]
MLENLFSYLFPVAILITISTSAYFFWESKNILIHHQQSNSKTFNNIRGMSISDGGFIKKKIQILHFDVLVNTNSIFIFPKSLYFIPLRKINLIFSHSDIKNTKSPEMLRELVIKNRSVDLVYYPKILLHSRTIRLQNLSMEQIKIFEDIKLKKNY